MTSNDFHNTVTNIDILYDVSDEGHIPFKVHVNSDNIPNLMNSTNNCAEKIRWNNMTQKDVDKCMLTDLPEIHVPTEVIGCKNINCNDENHVHAVNKMYNDIVSSLLCETRGMWMNAGKPRQGPIFELHVKSKARFKYAL